MSLKGNKVLVIEDNHVNQKMFEKFFIKEGAKYIRALNGKEGLELISKHSLDLVILDLQMPEVSGIELLERIKAEFHMKEFPIVVITSDKSEATRNICEDLGCDGFLNKPVKLAEIRCVILDLLEMIKAS